MQATMREGGPTEERGRAEKSPAPGAPGAAGAAGAPDVTLILPITQPTAEVEDVVLALSSELDRLGKTWECVLVFDGVRGAAWASATKLTAQRPDKVRLIGFQQSFGESVCLSAAFEVARGRIVVTSPQYVQIDPLELGPMLAAIEAGADFVTPWRHPRIDPWLNRLQSTLFNWVMRRIIHVRFHDLNCYFRALRREVLQDLVLYGDMYRFLPAIAYRQGFRVVEVRVKHLREWGGAGLFGFGVYLRRFLDILGMLFLAKFTLKPLRFFGSLGGALALLGAGLDGVVLVQYLIGISTATWSRPIFLIGFLLLVLGVQIIGFGLVGEIIIFTQARNLREYRVEKVWERRGDDASGG